MMMMMMMMMMILSLIQSHILALPGAQCTFTTVPPFLP